LYPPRQLAGRHALTDAFGFGEQRAAMVIGLGECDRVVVGIP
jgi:hypothetical protein